MVTYFNHKLTERARGQEIKFTYFYWEGKSVTIIFPPMNRVQETFLILQTGLHFNHLLNKKASGFQLSTVDYSHFQLVLSGMGRCSFGNY